MENRTRILGTMKREEMRRNKRKKWKYNMNLQNEKKRINGEKRKKREGIGGKMEAVEKTYNIKNRNQEESNFYITEHENKLYQEIN